MHTYEVGRTINLLDQLVAIFKGEYDTLRDLERKSRRLFYVAGGAALLGIVMTAIGMLAFLGIPLLVLGGGFFFFSMLWMMKLQKEPVRTLYCPYCASKNEVFISRKELSCDICSRRIGISPHGEPIPLEISDEDED